MKEGMKEGRKERRKNERKRNIFLLTLPPCCMLLLLLTNHLLNVCLSSHFSLRVYTALMVHTYSRSLVSF